MASLVGQQLKDAYDSLLKVDDNGPLGGTYKEITDGLGNGSNLYLGTGGRVGIGTSSPAVELDVNGEITADDKISINSSTNTEIVLQGGAEQDAILKLTESGLSGARLMYDGGDNKLYIGTGTGDTFTTRMTFLRDSLGVGIGTTSPSYELDIDGDVRADALWFRTNTATSPSATGGFYRPSLGAVAYGYNGSERLRILSSGGITFNGDTATANALDDYEEGTWTPVYAPSSGSFATMTMDVVSATYTKIGRQVTVRAYIRTDDVDDTGASGALLIEGLPFSSAGSNDGFSAISIGYSTAFSTTPDGGYINTGDTVIRLRKTSATTNSLITDLTTGTIADRNQLMITATYFV